MPKDQDQSEALTQVGRIKGAQIGMLERLRLQARATREAGDEDGANLILLKVIEITRENMRIENARRRALKAGSLGPILADLKALATEAEETEQQIRDLATALAAAARFLDVVRRILGVLP